MSDYFLEQTIHRARVPPLHQSLQKSVVVKRYLRFCRRYFYGQEGRSKRKDENKKN